MALIPITPDFFENQTLTAHPRRTFSSSSNGQITGSVRVFAQSSPIEKESLRLSAFDDSKFNATGSIEAFRIQWVQATRGFTASGSALPVSASNVTYFAEQYMEQVGSSSISLRKQKAVEVTRFEPSLRLTADTLRKNVVRDVLFANYRVKYPSLQWAATNYHTLNFFTSKYPHDVPVSSSLIFPAPSSSLTGETVYRPAKAFTFDFYINPRYTSDHRDGHTNNQDSAVFPAGTIMHMSSSYAVSLVTGSSVDITGKSNGFRLLLQLSHSAEIPPTYLDLDKVSNRQYSTGEKTGPYGEYPEADLAFISKDNSLQFNKWHHVSIRWGADTINDGTGSFLIDGVEDETFSIGSAEASGSIIPQSFGDPQGDPDALFIGNFYEGQNVAEYGGGPASTKNLVAQFFNSNAAAVEGVTDFTNGSFTEDPPKYSLRHPLQAEIHEIKIYDRWRDDPEIKYSMTNGVQNIAEEKGLIFYVPPFFTPESRKREVLLTPFQSYRSFTDDPFNVALSFGVGGHLSNLENFCREFVKKEYPRLLFLTASTINSSTDWATANEFLFATGSIRKRNLTVLPNDNGNFKPNFSLLISGTYTSQPTSGSLLWKYTNDFGTTDLSLISLTDMVYTGSILPGLIAPDAGMPGGQSTSKNSIIQNVAGASPEDPGVPAGSVLTVLQRTRDSSSNEVVFFDASNLFYGNKIYPGSFSIFDNHITGSGGKVKLTFADNGLGSLYRADASGSHPVWSSAGNIIYEEGIACILSPVVPYFGKEYFKTSFQGEQNIHILELMVPCPAGQINSSSNPRFEKLIPSDYASETSDEFVYITGINFHDDNLNIIARTNLAQPVVKRDVDKYMFRVKIDF